MPTRAQATHGLALLVLMLAASLTGCASQAPQHHTTTPVSDASPQLVVPADKSPAVSSIDLNEKQGASYHDDPANQAAATPSDTGSAAATHTPTSDSDSQTQNSSNTPQLPSAVFVNNGDSNDGVAATAKGATTSSNTPLHFNKPHPLEPFHASFRIYVSKIPMPITAKLDLEPTGKPDTWKMRFKVDSFLLSNLEESTFTWNNCKPKSIHYRHDFKGFGKHQFHDTSFYWDPPHVVNHSDEDNKEFPIPADSVDDLTVLLQAACVLSEGAKNYYATSIYGDDIRDNHFKLLRHETIDTPLGKLDTLVIEKVRGKKSDRKTLFWIAPALNYMLVKAKHIESSLLFGEVIMTGYKGPHQKP